MKKKGQRSTAERLVAGIQRGDPEAQRAFWKTYWPMVRADCVAILGDGLPADEVAVEILSDFLTRYVHGLSHPEAVRTYLRLTAVRRAAKCRKRMGNEVHTDMDAILAGAEVSTEEAAWAKALMPRLDACLAELTPKARQVLKLRYRGEMTNERIGSLVGGSKQYIGRLIRKSLQALKKCLQRKNGQPSTRKVSEGGVRA